ncbi:MAG TPA: MBL fold metallo-hydrolase [Methylomirabilota bacterium]|nr:MBL fold metallo-hydrolase [Methylomirabilota bacterium]
MVDPQHDIAPYLEAAAQKKLRVTHIIESHVQADHVSGARRLAEATGAAIFMHQAAGARFPHTELADEDRLALGNVGVDVIATPGHTPDGVSLLVTDATRAPEPWFVLTGDTLFSGGVGRPDLLGSGAERGLAEQLYDSLRGRLLTLPDHLEVYPAHFGGAACGKGLSGKPGSTVGFERRFNPALQYGRREEFVRFVLSDLPPQPPQFAENRRINLGLTT